MKRNFRILVSIIIIVLVVAISLVVYYFIKQNARKYEIENVEQYNYFVLKKSDKYGVIDRSGNVVIEPNYTNVVIPNPEKNVFVCYQNEDIQVFNDKNEEIMTEYEKVEPIRLKNIASDLMYEKSVLKYLENEKNSKKLDVKEVSNLGNVKFLIDNKEIKEDDVKKFDNLPEYNGENLAEFRDRLRNLGK